MGVISISEILQCTIKIDHVFFPKNLADFQSGNWTSFVATVLDVESGEPQKDSKGKLRVKGNAPALDFFEEYTLIGKLIVDPTYGSQYEIVSMGKQFAIENKFDQRVFLETILTESQINRMYRDLENPFDAISKGDFKTLATVKGISEEKALNIIKKFNSDRANALAYIELAEYGMTKNALDKLVERYRSAEVAVQKVKENPYVLIEDMRGYGWRKADALALSGGIAPDSAYRIEAYVMQVLKTIGEEGHTWIDPAELRERVMCDLEINSDDGLRNALYSLHEGGKILWDEEKTKIASSKLYNLELAIATELKRLMNGTCNKNPESDYITSIKQLEEEQGWDFTDEQLKAIETTIRNPVSIVTGHGGTGKSSAVAGVLRVLKMCDFAQTALSGRAASRLNEITHKEGFTIHRLLGAQSSGNGMEFVHNADNPLSYDIIILDEVSMVGAELFYSLIQAIPTGSRLIMLGDEGQLEAIGFCNVFKDMLHSGVIPLVRLTKIHRQAEKSAVITESLKIRRGQRLATLGWSGTETRGELQDFELDVFENPILTERKVCEHFMSIYEKTKDISQIQIVVPNRTRGNISVLNLNKKIQPNVNVGDKPFTNVKTKDDNGKTIEYTLKVDDCVICNTNNYHTKTPAGEGRPIFNGNRGVVKSIKPKQMIVDFEQWGLVSIPASKFHTIELAYALTCHKLQGSESNYVIIGADSSGYTLLSREWLYTAITRAKKKCILCAEDKALIYGTSRSNVLLKRTLLATMLHGEAF